MPHRTLAQAPLDRAVLAGLAEQVRRAHPDAPVLEVGGGPGAVTAHLAEAFGRAVSLDFHRLQPDDVAGLLDGAGFDLIARMVTAPEAASGPGTTEPQVPGRRPGVLRWAILGSNQ